MCSTARDGSAQEPLGLIAGNGAFPRLFAQAAHEAGEQLVVVALRGETEPDIEQFVDQIHWVEIGKLGKMIKLFRKAGVRRCAMAGGISKQRFFSPHRLDLAAIKLLASLVLKRDDEVLRAIASTFEQAGICIIPSTVYLQRALVQSAVLSRRSPTSQQMSDLRFGFRVAKSIGELDIGQAVVLKDGIVLAIEAIEGTDRCIERGARLGRGDVVVVKVSKPSQDLRFDLPAVGPKTIATMQRSGAAVLGLEAGKTLLLDPDETIREANRAGIVTVGLTELDKDTGGDEGIA